MDLKTVEEIHTKQAAPFKINVIMFTSYYLLRSRMMLNSQVILVNFGKHLSTLKM